MTHINCQADYDALAGKLSELLCDLTGGLLSKPTYDVATMVQAVKAHFERTVAADAWDEGYQAARDELSSWVREHGTPNATNPYREAGT